MNEPTEDEIKAAREAVQPYRKYINETPALLSLLYDIDLLPEQILLRINASRMIAICVLFKMIPPETMAAVMADDAAVLGEQATSEGTKT